jgi:hypothetical protein
MKLKPIFFAFFIVFTLASIAVPIPLFPGNMISPILIPQLLTYKIYIEALTNGIAFSFLSYLVFFLVDKKLDNGASTIKNSS